MGIPLKHWSFFMRFSSLRCFEVSFQRYETERKNMWRQAVAAFPNNFKTSHTTSLKMYQLVNQTFIHTCIRNKNTVLSSLYIYLCFR